MTNNNLGLYIHIPFCKKKCNYCDFYSVVPTDSIKKRYIESLCTEIKKWGERTARPIDTMYIGGGTPSLLSHNELALIFGAVRSSFTLLDGAEITVEINPGDNIADFLKGAVALGVNRVSIGVQSCNENELCVLGRRHNTEDAVCAVKAARNAGIKNISADIMIGLPDSNSQTLEQSIDGILALETEHISAYILKVEEGTPFDKMNISVPNDDKTAEQYMQLCNAMRKAGYEHYEISNFAKKGYQSRHNNRYWLQEEYIGIGPSAHSFFDGKRFFYERDINAFIDGAETVFDGFGGDQAEYIMLRLRLNTGLNFKEFEAKFNKSLDARIIDKAKSLEKHGLCRVNDSISLTDKGMLVSNTIISTLLGVIYEDI
ncbi:MAG: radical SAM family heme chaperone HemW [Clostridia bacterium]|nr:radical SAM family heme chaperone HemW [Clostridia bacterium]